MSPTLEEQIERLKGTIAELDAQRESLGDEFVDNAMLPFQQKLNELIALLAAHEERLPTEPLQQRKLVTLLFMDIVGSTQLTQNLDPEDVMAIMDSTLKRLAQPVVQHGGRVTRFMGDGFLSVFGAPLAREDDPERAVRAGLAIIELAEAIAVDLKKEWDIQDFRVRAGINTGLVMLGGETEAQDTFMGSSVNLAARLESAAPPGCLLISHDTYRHIRGVFDVEVLEPISVKGFDQPVQIYRVLAARPRAFRLYTRGVEGIETRMVGREAELKLLQEALLTAIEDGEGQMVTITGEAGVGKSRLLYEFQSWLELLPPPHVRFFEGRAHQETQGLPYTLLRDLFSFRFQIQDNDSAEIARKKISAGFAEVLGSSQDGEMRSHILGQWLGLDFSTSPHLKGVLEDPQQLRDRGLMYFVEYFQRLCETTPVMLFLEDIHWADDSSLDAINHLGQRMPRHRLLVVCAARTSLFERRPYWGEGLAYHRRIDLQPLSKRESRQLVLEILRFAVEVPPELRELVVEGAEGNPYYLEELIKMLVEDGVILKGEEIWHIDASRLAETVVPPTLAGVLQARLDSLPAQERVILQQASVVGRQFWDRVVAYIHATGDSREDIVPETLTALRQRELIFRREESAFVDASEFIFKHDILREVTYESVLKRLRRFYHGMVADWLIAHSAERSGEVSGLIAEHLLRAGRDDQAADYLLRAGESALAAYANSEAEAYFRKAFEILPEATKQATCLASLGETLGRQGRTDEAEQILREAIDRYFEMGEYDRTATLFALLSRMLWYESYAKAWDACQEGLARLDGTHETPGMARLLAEAGRTAYFRVQDEGKVAVLLNQAIEMAERFGLLEARADASITLAIIKDDPQESIANLKETADLCEQHGLLRTAARAHNNIGYFCYRSLAGAEQTHRHYRKSAEIERQIGNINAMIDSLNSSGPAFINMGYMSSWREHSLEFLHKSSATESQIEAYLNEPLGWIHYYRGEWMQAVETFCQQIAEQRMTGSIQTLVGRSFGLVFSILELDRFTHTGDLSQAESALLENISVKWNINQSNFMLAAVLARKGLISEAKDRVSQAIQTASKQLTKGDEMFRLEAEGEIAIAQRQWDSAVSIYQQMIDIYQPCGYRWEWARWLIHLGDALLTRDMPGDQERVQEAYSQSLEMFTQMDAPGYVQVLEQRLGESHGYSSKNLPS